MRSTIDSDVIGAVIGARLSTAHRPPRISECSEEKRAEQNCLSTAHRPPRISECSKEKRAEQNLFVCSGNSEVEVTNKRRLQSTYCAIKANY